MNQDNPFAAPEADITPQVRVEKRKKSPLADRGTRFVASLVDGIVNMLYGLPILYAFGFFDYLGRQEQLPFGRLAACGILSYLAFIAVHGYFLYKKGQTLGKLATGIRIADLHGKVPNFGKVLLLRYLPINLCAFIPLVGTFLPLVDVLFIFREDRRCLHDLLAGTKVVKTK